MARLLKQKMIFVTGFNNHFIDVAKNLINNSTIDVGNPGGSGSANCNISDNSNMSNAAVFNMPNVSCDFCK